MLSVGTVLVFWYALCLPKQLFNSPTSTILEDTDGKLLAGRIAADGQWRFPQNDSLPEKFVKCIIYFEDEYFYQHPGFNPVSFGRALKQNINAKRVVSGGSTLSMQTIRLSRKGQSRTVFEKLVEVILATRMELRFTKQEILEMYAAHAPFGGNVVGLDAAAWRYYGRSPNQLSWGEMATLAVLPNAPSLIYPGKNSGKLLQKRNRLLDKLERKGVIDKWTCELAKEEHLPGSPHAIPRITPHLLARAIKEGKLGKRVQTSINTVLQQHLNRIVNDYHGVLSQNEIHNMAVVVMDVNSGNVLGYVGNTNCSDEGSGSSVDVIMAPRSTGSILKPFLYNFMLQDGAILPNQLVADVPTRISGYAPKNFDQTYDGAVPASHALARSLNIPAVRMLRDYGLEQFYHRLQKFRLSTINRSVDHYGLSIILGGAEAKLWELTIGYLNMARVLNRDTCIVSATYDLAEKVTPDFELKDALSRAALWWTAEALATLNRPWQEAGWQEFNSSQKIAWKTGTSFGHRDAWSIGFNSDYVVGVWVGNADGEGRPGLTGLGVAAPVLFKVFKHLPDSKWFEEPQSEMASVEVCTKSGFLATHKCDEKEVIHVPAKAEQGSSCPYHQLVHLDSSKQFRVSSDCYPVAEMKTESWFVLPPVQEWYYRKKDPNYRKLPLFSNNCQPENLSNMAVIYPEDNSGIFIPRNLDGTLEKAVFEIAHRNPERKVYWHLDDQFVGSSVREHSLELSAKSGPHKLTIVDEEGETLSWNFEVLEK